MMFWFTVKTDENMMRGCWHFFLGQILSGSGIESDPEKTAAITKFKEPANVSETRRFFRHGQSAEQVRPPSCQHDKTSSGSSVQEKLLELGVTSTGSVPGSEASAH